MGNVFGKEEGSINGQGLQVVLNKENSSHKTQVSYNQSGDNSGIFRDKYRLFLAMCLNYKTLKISIDNLRLGADPINPSYA